MQDSIHKPPKEIEANTEIIVTTGSQDALCKCAEMLLEVGDPVVSERYAYTGTMLAMLPYRPDFICIEADKDGMRSDLLAEALAKCKKVAKYRKFSSFNFDF